MDRKIVTIISTFVFLLLVLVALLALRVSHLFAVVMLAGVFSLLSALLLVLMDAVDVAFTEAAVGAGVSTVLMLSTMALTARVQKPSKHNNLGAFLAVSFAGFLLVYGTLDMPNYGSNDSPAQQHLSNLYLTNSPEEVGFQMLLQRYLQAIVGLILLEKLP